MLHHLLIYHSDSNVYGDILSKRLPQLEIKSAVQPAEAVDFVRNAEIILSWQIPDELLERAKSLRWFSSMAAGNEDLVKNPHLPEKVILTKAMVYGEMMAEYVPEGKGNGNIGSGFSRKRDCQAGETVWNGSFRCQEKS